MRLFFTASLTIVLLLALAACQGATGPAGQQGPPGIQGPAGAPGVDGSVGLQGPAGEAASINMADVKKLLGEVKAEPVAPPKWRPEAYTKHFVEAAIKMYEAEGLEATVAYYNSPESVDGQWYMFIVDQSETLVAHPLPELVGMNIHDVVGPTNYPSGSGVYGVADEDGAWFDYPSVNTVSGKLETKHSWMVLHDGIVFGSGWYGDAPSKDDGPAYTRELVKQSIDLYNAVGLDKTVEHYNSEESTDGPWYVFIFDEDDTFLAHAANPAYVSQHASFAVGPNNYPTGVAVAASAEPQGAWFDYTFLNPGTGTVESKHSWMVVHDGLTFGTGWYEDGPSRADGNAYTKAYVQQAINLYNAVGLEDTIAYYNTPESVDGQWYLYMGDAETGTLIGHGVNPAYIGLHASEIVGPNNYPSGSVVFESATETGAWSHYTFPDPASGQMRSKHSWTIIHDGIIFGSGWYEPGPAKTDEPAYTKSFVQQAINLYDAVGLDAAIEYYNSEASVDGQWYAFIVDTETGVTIGHFNPALRDRDPSLRVDSTGYYYGPDLLAATPSGSWISYVITNPGTGEERRKHTYAVRHGDYIFASGWYE